MAVYHTSTFIKAIEKKGFVRDKTHHDMFWYYLNGNKTSVRTRTSQGEKEFNDGLLSQRRKQIGLSNKKQMLDLINCLLKPYELKQILIENGRIKLPNTNDSR
ncbi:MAG: hypothetical protein MUO76_15810 [Anaerolineaceae bacterium]|nr:hypothetical protein [Anaerolineaceae bacterium]